MRSRPMFGVETGARTARLPRVRSGCQRRRLHLLPSPSHYAMERFLYRLSTSPHRARFVLKGHVVRYRRKVDPRAVLAIVDPSAYAALPEPKAGAKRLRGEHARLPEGRG